MPYLIDGHNLIGKVPNLRQDDPEDEKQLLELLQEFCQRTGKHVEVYFEKSTAGHAGAKVIGRVTARFVREGESLVLAISRWLKRFGKEAANWTVVSSDNDVRAAAKRSRARVISSADFADQLLGKMTRKEESDSPKLDKNEVADWLRLFKNGQDED